MKKLQTPEFFSILNGGGHSGKKQYHLSLATIFQAIQMQQSSSERNHDQI